MGTFCSNLQLKRKKSIDTDTVVDAISVMMKNSGYVEAESSDFDRKITLIARPDSKWMSLFDSNLDASNIELSTDMAISLGKVIDTEILCISVIDSDYFNIELFRDGKMKANITNLNEMSTVSYKNIKAWINCGEEINSKTIKSIFSKHTVFVDDKISEFANTFSIDNSLCLLSHRHLQELDLNSVITLFFKNAKEDQEDTELDQTKLQFVSYYMEYKSNIGDNKSYKFTVKNIGKSSVGFQVIICGEAINSGFISASDCQLSVDDISLNKKFWKVTLQNGTNGYVCDFLNLVIPDSCNIDYPQTQKDFKILIKTYISVNISFENHRKCDSHMFIYFLPIKNAREGQVGTNMKVEII